jgi:hypothetical protein
LDTVAVSSSTTSISSSSSSWLFIALVMTELIDEFASAFSTVSMAIALDSVFSLV